METLDIITRLASLVIFLFSVWAVFFAAGFKDKIIIKKGFITLAFGSYAYLVHPSENAKSLIIVAVAFVCLLRFWNYRKEIFDCIKTKFEHVNMCGWHVDL